MNKAEAYAIWAPEDCDWSKWVKPVLFAYMEGELPTQDEAAIQEWGISYPTPVSDTILVADLPGPHGVNFGLRLAQKGYRPIPLYNALPRPNLPDSPETPQSIFSAQELASGNRVAVEVWPLVRALRLATDELAQIQIPVIAPPVFLLDSRRRGGGQSIRFGMFDNRSVTYPSDFPSAEYLKGRAVRNVVVVQEGKDTEFDLVAILREWEAGGLSLTFQAPGLEWDPRPLRLPRPSFLRKVWFWFQSNSGLQRNPNGSFGAFIHGSAG